MIDHPAAGAELILDFDLLGSAGDVAAARRLSKAILTKPGLGDEHVSLAQLVLTAAFLHMDACVREEPSVARLNELLGQLSDGRRIGFETSPMQFVQYVACEIDELRPETLHAALQFAREALTLYPR